MAGETNIAAVRVDLLKNRDNRSSQVPSIMRVLTLGDIFSRNTHVLQQSGCVRYLLVLQCLLGRTFCIVSRLGSGLCGYGMHEVHVKYCSSVSGWKGESGIPTETTCTSSPE